MAVEDQNRSVPIAIIGVGCLLPKADGVESYWSNIQDGVDAITDVPASHWRPEDYFDKDPKKADHTYAARGGFLSPVEFPALELGISPNTLEAIDTTQLLGLLVAKRTLESAGYGADRDFDRNRVSVILGVTGTLELVVPLGARLGHPQWKRALKEAGVDDAVAQEVVQKIADSYVGWQEDSFPGLLGNVVAGRIANRLDLGGTNCVVDAACASSLSALHLAMLELSAGRSDMVLTGGMDTFNDIFMYMCFSKTPALSPTGRAKPFDARADGTILGEGLGCILLKRLDDAERDGDKILAVIRGLGTSSDGKGQAIYAPSPSGQSKALRQAYRLAGVTPETIELVEAHGTGTRAGDAAEVAALNDVYQSGADRSAPWCALGSVKSQIGHTKAAAGAAGLIKAALALHHKVLPPTIHVAQPIEQVAPGQSAFYVNTEKRPWMPPQAGHPRRAAVSAFGFGGSNFHCVLEEYGSEKETVAADSRVQILAFSAATPERLRERLDAFPANLGWDDLRIEAARGRAAFDPKHGCRLTIVVERDKKPLAELIANARSAFAARAEQDTAKTPDGVFFSSQSPPGKCAMIFPGQGSQYAGMLRDLTCRYPALHTELADADASFAKNRPTDDPRRLSDFIYPLPAFDEQQRTRNEIDLRATDVAQPALGALSLGAVRLLESFGVRPDAVAGHSYGELAALCAAGWIDPSTLHSLSQLRGQFMSAGTGDRGGMLAVRAPLDGVANVLREDELALTIANRNAPSQCVLSGSSAEIARAQEAFARRRIDSFKLPVAAAFHSRFVADACIPFREALDRIAIHPTEIPVYCNTTAAAYPRDPREVRRLLANQLAEPVEFVAEIENLYAAGVRTFLEVGPGNKLSALIGSILANRPHALLTLDASAGKRSGVADLARVIAQLAALGYSVQLSRWDEGQADKRTSSEKKPTLTVPLCGANYVKPKTATTPVAKTATSIATKNGAAAHVNGATTNRASENRASSARAKTVAPAPQSNTPKPMNDAPAAAASHPSFAATQENLIALQKLGEQTAHLHRQFLEGQDRTLQIMQSLIDQQNRLTTSSPMPGGAIENDPPIETLAVPSAPPTKPAPTNAPARNGQHHDAIAPPANGRFEAVLLDVVASVTGYPAEMLQLDMELDTDLGIDSIKRVEIFAVLQEKFPGSPPIKSDQIGAIRTLRQVVSLLGSGAFNGHAETAAPSRIPAEASDRNGNHRNPAPSLDDNALTKTLLAVVAGVTGYPAEMLQLDMELDTDLGIDSIKRVEIFAVLQEKLPSAPTVKSEHMASLRTLRHVAAFLGESTARDVTTPMSVEPHANGHKNGKSNGRTPSPAARRIPERNGDSAKHATGNPLQRLVLSAAALIESATRNSIALARDGEIWITADDAALAPFVARRLHSLGFKTKIIPANDVRALAAPTRLAGLIILVSMSTFGDAGLLEAFQLLQAASAGLQNGGQSGGAALMTVARMDGSFGLSRSKDAAPAFHPAMGGLAGLVKTARHEWPDVHCKALDLASDLTNLDEAAVSIVDEFLIDGPIEVGVSTHGLCTPQLTATPLVHAESRALLRPDDAVIVTGGARGVTAETAVALAEAFAPTLILLGRSEPPNREPDWLAPLTDEADIKRALHSQANGRGSPKEIGDRYRAVSANREILRTMDRIEAAGAKAVYRQVDVRDGQAIGALAAEIRRDVGPIKGFVHGAGVLADRRIEEKTADQFATVYATKVEGARTMLDALRDDDLQVVALFSSSTGRFGRIGQIDYAAANEVLNKLAQQEARRRPDCRVVAVNWGPWDGGMVNASLKKIFADEGVGVIPLQRGADHFVGELRESAGQAVEVVVMGSLPDDGTSRSAESPAANLTVAFEYDLTVESMPILKSHVLKGHAVFPVALMVEWLAHAALHDNPGLGFHGFDDLRVFKGIVLPDRRPLRLSVLAAKAVKENDLYRVSVEIRGAAPAGRDALHARASVLLAAQLPPTNGSMLESIAAPYLRAPSEIYGELLFHGTDLQGILHVEGCSEDGIAASVASAPPPSAWIQKPLRSSWLANPLALDCAFQLMILWSHEHRGAGSLPNAVGRYRQFRRSFPSDGVRIVARVTKQTEHRAQADIDFVDREGAVIARIADYECVIDASLNRAFRSNQLQAGTMPSS